MSEDKITVRLTKTGDMFGHLAKGAHFDIKVPADIGGEQEAKIRARRMMERDYSAENQMEWEAEIVAGYNPITGKAE